jgi:hypothetical protein
MLNRLCADACSPGCVAVAVMSRAGTTELGDEEFYALVVMAWAQPVAAAEGGQAVQPGPEHLGHRFAVSVVGHGGDGRNARGH